MKENDEILDEFGKKIIEKLFDPSIGNLKSLRVKDNPPAIFKDYVDLFKKLDDTDFDILKKYIAMSTSNAIYNFINILDENDHYKIIYEDENKQIDLNKISEMLKSEHIGENGWIVRYSKEID